MPRLIPRRPPRVRAVDALARDDLAARGALRRSAVAQGVDLANDLTRAVELGQLTLHYQPIVRLRTGECTRVEALLRWEHPELGLVPPAELLLLAEQLGLLVEIGRFVLDAALRQREAWRAHDLQLGVALNLAPAELAEPLLADRLAAVLQSHRVDPAEVTLELPVSTLHEAYVTEAVRRFTHTGVRLSLDGLSASQPPPRSLVRLVHELKVSRWIVMRAVADPSAALVLRSAIELARDLGLTAVAVGVEDRLTRDLVASLGYDEAQGYFISRPLLAQDLLQWRRWVAGLALTGGLVATGQVGGVRATAASDPPAERVVMGSSMPACCVLDLSALLTTSATGPDHRPSQAEIERRTGTALVAVATSRADLLVERGLAPGDQRRLAIALDESVASTEREYGRTFADRPAVYVFATRASFALGLQRGFGHRGPEAGVLAAANGGVTLLREGAIVINWANVSAANPLAILRHELTHAIVHQIIGPQAQLPAWVDEGLATLAERDDAGSSDGAISRDPYVVLSTLAAGEGSLASLASPADWMVQNAKLGGEGYRVAGAAVRLMQERLGPRGMLGVLEETGRSNDFAAAYARAAGESLATFTRSFPSRLAAAHPGPGISVVPAEGGVRYLLNGFAPGTEVAVSIKGVNYDLHFAIVTDRYGLYEAVFGATAPPGEYRLTATGPGGTASALLSTN